MRFPCLRFALTSQIRANLSPMRAGSNEGLTTGLDSVNLCRTSVTTEAAELVSLITPTGLTPVNSEAVR